MITLTQSGSVGVAPGTTTLVLKNGRSLGDVYTNPPQIKLRFLATRDIPDVCGPEPYRYFFTSPFARQTSPLPSGDVSYDFTPPTFPAPPTRFPTPLPPVTVEPTAPPTRFPTPLPPQIVYPSPTGTQVPGLPDANIPQSPTRVPGLPTGNVRPFKPYLVPYGTEMSLKGAVTSSRGVALLTILGISAIAAGIWLKLRA
jgi:hypothetical protein